MNLTARIDLLPLGHQLQVPVGTRLQDILFGQGVEFPCGGRGKCRGCRVKVLAGELPITPEDTERLDPTALSAGWRLACRAEVRGDLRLELAQWDASILTDDRSFAFQPRPGLGIAIDLGTTTLVAQILDRQTGEVLGVRTGLNAQARHGADIMSRIDTALAGDGAEQLRRMIREQLGGMVAELLADSGRHDELGEVIIVGNTVMHHLFSGLPVAPLAAHPFEPEQPGERRFNGTDLCWTIPTQCAVRFLPCLGSFVGSDILAGILATGLADSSELVALVDLGTNGEMVVGNRDRLLCASTAAGPAFEGARISMGMRATTGAIAAVAREGNGVRCQVLGDAEPRGLCGSGLVDAVAAALDLGWVLPSGRLAQRTEIPLAGPVRLTGGDIRELQLAKGAIAAGLDLLARQWGARIGDLHRIHLAGAFGNYITRQSSKRIGLLPFGPERVEPAGNTALLGAKLALFGAEAGDPGFRSLLARVRHVPLNDDPLFHEVYVNEMVFPGPT